MTRASGIVVEAAPNGKFKILDDEKATVRLGEGLYRTGELTPASWQRAIEALVRMKKVVDGYRVRAIEAVATSAVRQAANGREFIELVDREVGITVQVISGEEEAEPSQKIVEPLMNVLKEAVGAWSGVTEMP